MPKYDKTRHKVVMGAICWNSAILSKTMFIHVAVAKMSHKLAFTPILT